MPNTISGAKPTWLTFDCYGTLAQWDEGLIGVVSGILASHGRADLKTEEFIEVYDWYEHAAEQSSPFRNFKSISAYSLEMAMKDLGMHDTPDDAQTLVSKIASFPPFPEVPDTLRRLKKLGYQLCVISNTDEDLIQGNVGQMGGHIDRIVTAEAAQAYKPSKTIFEFAHKTLGVTKNDIVHICASPHLDLAAARDMAFRCIWVDRGTARKPLPDYEPDAVAPNLVAAADLLETSFR
ncbi:MAG: haloacid dehalogenase type II [Pseudomonadota bacterium]